MENWWQAHWKTKSRLKSFTHPSNKCNNNSTCCEARSIRTQRIMRLPQPISHPSHLSSTQAANRAQTRIRMLQAPRTPGVRPWPAANFLSIKKWPETQPAPRIKSPTHSKPLWQPVLLKESCAILRRKTMHQTPTPLSISMCKYDRQEVTVRMRKSRKAARARVSWKSKLLKTKRSGWNKEIILVNLAQKRAMRDWHLRKIIIWLCQTSNRI